MSVTPNPFSLEGKTILVTGASSGIGCATAILCAQMGASVIITGRNPKRLQQSFDALSGQGHISIIADLTVADDREKLIRMVPALDGVAYCAGIGHRKLGKSLTQDDLAFVMDTNFNSVVLLQAGLLSQKRIKKDASLVFLSSRAAEIPAVANSLYSASKGALTSYAKCLSVELAPRHIRVNCICPAIVWTPIVLADGVSEEELKEREKLYPLKRYGRPEDIANLAVFLLSEASSWMTGSCIDITGGSIEI